MIRKSWRVNKSEIDKLRSLLLESNGKEDLINDAKIIWRIRVNDSIFTLYSNYTFFADCKDDRLLEEIESIISPRFKDYCLNSDLILGFDETGKGEVLGSMVLGGIIIKRDKLREVDDIIGSADTKKKHSLEYWESKYNALNGLIEEKNIKFIQPIFIDKYNLNELLDIHYMRMIRRMYNKFNPYSMTIVIDDYGITDLLYNYLSSLKAVIAEPKADNNYLVVKIASVVAKREREYAMKKLREKYGAIGSGNLNDKVTIRWLEELRESNKEYPSFVKQSYIKGSALSKEVGKPKERFLPSYRFKFKNGIVSIKDFNIFCANCNTSLESVKLGSVDKRYDIRCIECNEIIKDANREMLYYIGCIIPDTNTIIGSIISKDLENTRLFEGFTFLIYEGVREECKGGGKSELGRIGDYNSMGMINLEYIDKIDNRKVDDILIDLAIEYNAILMSRDDEVYNKAISKRIFCIKS